MSSQLTSASQYTVLSICRACGNESENYVSLFGVCENGMYLADMIAACTDIKIGENDGAPSNICYQCCTKLRTTYDFCKLVKDTNEKFKQFISAQQLQIETHVDCTVFAETLPLNVEIKEEIEANNVADNAAIDDFPNDSDEFSDSGNYAEDFKVDTDDEDDIPLLSFIKPKQEKNKKCLNFSPSRVEKKQKKEKTEKKQKTLAMMRNMKLDYECYKCNKKGFQKLLHLRKHMKDHMIATPMKCIVCGMFYTQRNLEQHLCKGTSVECEFCPETTTFTTTLALIKHLERKVCDQKQASHKCVECRKYFAMKWMIECHLEQHLIGRKYVCKICTRGFSERQTFDRHENIHKGEASFLCSLCGQGFKTTHGLRRHSLRHVEIKPIACDQCPRRFYDMTDLRSHLEREHTPQKFECETCKKLFATKHSLGNHRRCIHGNLEKPTCPVCNVVLMSKHNLKRHLTTHTGERPYKCKYCTDAYRTSCDLYKHLRLHLGRNVFQCDRCNESFRRHAELRKHLIEHE